MPDYTAKKGAYGDPLTLTLRDGDGAVLNLTGYTGIVLHMWPIHGGDPVVDGEMVSVVSAASGTLRYDWAATVDLDTPGHYLALIGGMTPDAKPFRYPTRGYLVIEVQEREPEA